MQIGKGSVAVVGSALQTYMERKRRQWSGQALAAPGMSTGRGVNAVIAHVFRNREHGLGREFRMDFNRDGRAVCQDLQRLNKTDALAIITSGLGLVDPVAGSVASSVLGGLEVACDDQAWRDGEPQPFSGLGIVAVFVGALGLLGVIAHALSGASSPKGRPRSRRRRA